MTIADHARASFGVVDDVIGRVAGSDVPVLIRGERGTGKELAARAVHGSSGRRDHPFVKINCASSLQTLDAELFGSDRGSGHQRPGRLEFASHGTLFLDRIGELPAALQPRLERVLQEGGFARPGSRDLVHLDLRVIASAEQDLEQLVTQGLFHEALFFRLNAVCLTLAPLRQRRHELPALARFFVARYAAHYNKPEVPLVAATLRALVRHDWPGNLQELDAVMKRTVLRGTVEGIEDDLEEAASALAVRPEPEQLRPTAAPASAIGAATATAGQPSPGFSAVPLKEFGRQAAAGAERELIFRTLQHTRWNRREAAEMLGVSYKALLYKIKRAELDGAS
jgi:two-component system response regulator AtoC